MKRIMRIIAITGITLCLCGFGLFTIGYAFGGGKYIKTPELNNIISTALKAKELFTETGKDDLSDQRRNPNSDDVSDNKGLSNVKASANSDYHTYKLDNKKLNSVHTITANLINIDFDIKPSKNNCCYLSYELHCKNKKNPLTYNVKNGTLNLKETNGKPSIWYDWSTTEKKQIISYRYCNKVTLYVPSKDMFRSSTIKMDVGDLSINGLHSATVNLQLSEGDLSLQKVFFNEGTVATDEGDIDIANFNLSKELKISTLDGDVTCRNFKVSGKLLIDTDDGDITLQVNKKSLNNLTITMYTEDGDMTVNKIYGNKKKRTGDGWHYTKKAAAGNISLKVTTDLGDIFLR